MAGSTINGNAGASASGAIVTAVPVDIRGALLTANGVPVLPQQAVVSSTGAYSFALLNAGYYLLKIAPQQSNPSGASAPANPVQPMTQAQLYVDGVSTYAI